MRQMKLVVMLLTIGLMAIGAQATDFTGAEDSAWSNPNNWTAGVPDSSTAANIGTSGTGSVSVTISGTADAGRTQVGLSGGASVTGSVTIAAGATLNTWGSFLNTDEGEDHGFDVGGYAAGNLTLEANATLTMQVGDSMGLGKDDRWVGGFDTHVIMKPGSTINVGSAGDGWASFGLGDGNASQILDMDRCNIDGVLFHIGGTVIVRGTVRASGRDGGGYRAREYSEPKGTIMKLVGDSPLFFTPGGIQLIGLQLDVSELNHEGIGVWFTVMDCNSGGYWGSGAKNVGFVAGTDPNWHIRLVHPLPTYSERKVQVRYVPEPATLALLAVGGLAALIRKRR